MATRGIRNNNPGNIDFVHQAGATLETGTPDPRFARFPTMDAGIIALIDQLKRYFNRGANTCAKIIQIFAPPVENQTSGYVYYVASRLEVRPDTVLTPDAQTLAGLAMAISHMENGALPFDQAHVLYLAQNYLSLHNA